MSRQKESARYPGLLRGLGWLLAGVMWAYPIDAFYTWWIVRQYERMMPQVPASGSPGFVVDLGLGVAHTGIVGWLGSLACFFGLVWLAVAGTAWIKSRLGGRRLDRSSRLVLVAVSASVAAVFLSHYLLWYVFGLLVS
jgi:hypothetical protein